MPIDRETMQGGLADLKASAQETFAFMNGDEFFADRDPNGSHWFKNAELDKTFRMVVSLLAGHLPPAILLAFFAGTSLAPVAVFVGGGFGMLVIHETNRRLGGKGSDYLQEDTDTNLQQEVDRRIQQISELGRRFPKDPDKPDH